MRDNCCLFRARHTLEKIIQSLKLIMRKEIKKKEKLERMGEVNLAQESESKKESLGEEREKNKNG